MLIPIGLEEEDNDFYSKKNRSKLVDEDELTSEEENFMEGYEEDLKEESKDNVGRI